MHQKYIQARQKKNQNKQENKQTKKHSLPDVNI